MSSSNTSPEQPIADDGGIQVPATTESDPFKALDELMAVVEALCPTWPARESFEPMEQMLL